MDSAKLHKYCITYDNFLLTSKFNLSNLDEKIKELKTKIIIALKSDKNIDDKLVKGYNQTCILSYILNKSDKIEKHKDMIKYLQSGKSLLYYYNGHEKNEDFYEFMEYIVSRLS